MKKIKILSSLMSLIIMLAVITSFSSAVSALDDDAEIATWKGFRKAAVSFTFDMGAPSHISTVAPLFDEYGYKASFYLVADLSPDWKSFQKLADNGHEIGSNSKTYPADMSGEEKSSKEAIEKKISSKYGCITLAYPNGNVPADTSAVKANYIAARTRTGSVIVHKGPSDWTRVPSYLTGAEGTIKTSNDFVQKIQSTVNINGWVVFDSYGISQQNNGPASYSPTALNAIEGALSWTKDNDKDVWVAPLCEVAMYLKERKASKIVKTKEGQSSVTYSLTHEIADDICRYDYPLSIRCPLPTGWNDVYVTQGKNVLDSKIVNGMVWFDAVPNGGDIVVDKAGAIDPTVKLSQDVFEYDGTVKTPSVTVKNGNTVLKKGTDYTVTYDDGRIEPGAYNVKVTLIGRFSGSKTVSFTIKKSASLKLDKTSASVVCGNTLTLKAALTGSADAVSWKSSDTKTATVDSKGKITAKMAGKVTITATAAGKSAKCAVTVLYKDVTNSSDFWYAPTNYLTAKGVVKGYANQTEFRPANECTRAQMVTFLYRLQGEPKTKSNKCKFDDVKSGDYFFKPVIWAVENGITTGVSATKFEPQKVCTRAQTVTFLWRMAGKPEPGKNAKKFTDVKAKDYFYKATLWASDMKILAGYDDGTFKPDGKCLRRQMVTFLYKYDKYVNGKG